ncbi:MAG: helix-turn-helix domain-containing protein [Candidatus Odinarchaeota archaeon]
MIKREREPRVTNDITNLYRQLLLQASDRLKEKGATITEITLLEEAGLNQRICKNMTSVRQFTKTLVLEAKISKCRRALVRAYKSLVRKGTRDITEKQLLLEVGMHPATVSAKGAVQELLFELEFKHEARQAGKTGKHRQRNSRSRVDRALVGTGMDVSAVVAKMVMTFLTTHQRPVSLYRICKGTGLSPGTVVRVLSSLEKDGRIEKLVIGHLPTRWLLKEQQNTAGEPVIVPAISETILSYRDKQVIWWLMLDTRIYSFLKINGPTSEKELVARLPSSSSSIHRRLTLLAKRGIVESVTVKGSGDKVLAFWYLIPANERESKLLHGQLEQLKK